MSVDVRLQPSRTAVFEHVLGADERVDFSVCNPPFYESRDSFRRANARKRRLLAESARRRNGAGAAAAAAAASSERRAPPAGASSDNFGGSASELWCPGGEAAFVDRTIAESEARADRCLWFSTLVSRKARVPDVETRLRRARAAATRVVATGRGQKTATLVFWSFQDAAARRAWAEARWDDASEI